MAEVEVEVAEVEVAEVEVEGAASRNAKATTVARRMAVGEWWP